MYSLYHLTYLNNVNLKYNTMKFNARVGFQFVYSVQRGIELNQIKHLFRSREALNQNEDRNSGSISRALNTFPRCPHNRVYIYAGIFSPKYNIFLNTEVSACKISVN